MPDYTIINPMVPESIIRHVSCAKINDKSGIRPEKEIS